MMASDDRRNRMGWLWLALRCPWEFRRALLNLREYFGPFESHASSRPTDSARRQSCQRARSQLVIPKNANDKFGHFRKHISSVRSARLGFQLFQTAGIDIRHSQPIRPGNAASDSYPVFFPLGEPLVSPGAGPFGCLCRPVGGAGLVAGSNTTSKTGGDHGAHRVLPCDELLLGVSPG